MAAKAKLAPGLRIASPAPREHQIHAQIARLFTAEIARAGHLSPRGVCWWSVDHADFAGRVPGARMARGIVAGIPDMVLLFLGRAFFIELKSETGHLSDPQEELATAILWSGARYGVARDAVEALALLDTWEIPRAGRVRGHESYS